MKTKILIMCQYFYPDKVSSSLLPFEISKFLVENGFEVNVISGVTSEQDYLENEIIDGVNINRVKYKVSSKKSFFSRLYNYFNFTNKVRKKIKKSQKTDIVIVFSNPPILPLVASKYSKKNKSKLIFVSYDVYPEIGIELGVLSETGIITKVMKKINKDIYKNISRVITLSDQMKDFLIRERRIDSNKLVTIPNWDTDNYFIEKETEIVVGMYQKTMEDLVITYLGNLGTAQDEKTIMKVILDLSIKNNKIKFVFAGNGNKMKGLCDFKERNKLDNLYIYDFLSGENLEYIKRVTDIYLVTLNEKLESLAVPSKIYTYINEEKPIISIMPSNMDIVIDMKLYQNGIHVNVGDSDKLSRKILDVYHDREILNSMSKNSKKMKIDKYSKERSLKGYLKVIEDLMEE